MGSTCTNPIHVDWVKKLPQLDPCTPLPHNGAVSLRQHWAI